MTAATVASHVDQPRFRRRDWLAEDVLAELHRADTRFVLITGPPGVGKSAFLAQLARDHPDWPIFFSRTDQRSPLGSAGARGLLLHVGYHLATARLV